MKTKCTNVQSDAFLRSIEPRFKSFKDKIKRLSKSNNINFNEDVFMDTIIKCTETFPTINATDLDVDNYFWVAFKQNSFSTITRNKFRNSLTIEEYGDNIIDEEYNEDIDIIVDSIKYSIEEEFGEEIYTAWKLHVCDNYTYSELKDCGYGHLNLHNEFKKVKRFVQKIVKRDDMLRIMLNENNYIN